MTVYVIAGYSLFILISLVGSFSSFFNANCLQRISLGVLDIWCFWRISMVMEEGIAWPHEPFLVTGFLMYSSATAYNTIFWSEK